MTTSPRRHPPLRFGWLLLASLDNRCFAYPAARCAAVLNVLVAIRRFASAGSYSLRSTIGASRTRRPLRRRPQDARRLLSEGYVKPLSLSQPVIVGITSCGGGGSTSSRPWPPVGNTT